MRDEDAVRQALDDIARHGQDGFEDLSLCEASDALLAAYGGWQPTPAVVRRTQVRQAVAVALRQFTHQRDALWHFTGRTH